MQHVASLKASFGQLTRSNSHSESAVGELPASKDDKPHAEPELTAETAHLTHMKLETPAATMSPLVHVARRHSSSRKLEIAFEDPVLQHFSQRDQDWWVDAREVEWGDEPKCIGKGSVSFVFQTTWKSETVAVKILRLDKSSRTDDKLPSYSLDLSDELTVVSKNLHHPNIVDFYGAGITVVEGRTLPLLIYECVSGGSVEDLLRSKSDQLGKPWRPARVVSLSWSVQLLHALSFLHEHETPIAHRDVKPANLLVSADLATVKLADFSLACSIDHESGSVPHVAGSMRYMAPEVTSKKPYALDKADVFSAAVTCWCLTHGLRPYTDISDPVAAMRLVRRGLRPSVERGADLARVFSAAWDDHPRRRPTARAFASRMADLLASEKRSWRKSLLRTVKAAFGPGSDSASS